ncbi:cation:proton antiporter [Romboutsia sp.]|uniref:cation:proton antiporter n=1 Tax=Romboutsia sp. TaxID=1965302 RepID=UPI0039C934CD
MGSLVSYLKLPKITGYLIAGLLISPHFLNLVPRESIEALTIISEVALGFIAYNIGSSLNYSKLKKIGKGIVIITLFESLTAVLIVDLFMIFVMKQSIAFSISLGAIAAATAPAATIMVINQYKAKGPLTNTLIPVVAIDDAIAVIAFGISISIAQIFIDGSDSFSFISLLNPIIEISISFLVGIILGFLLSIVTRNKKDDDQVLTIIIGMVFFAVGTSTYFGLSPLLTCILLGATITNIAPNSNKLFSLVDRITPPIYLSFFTISGLELDIAVLKTVGMIGIGYVVCRVMGKVLGVYIGAKIAKSDIVVQKYLGLTLIPQAGVAIGLAMVVQAELPLYGQKIRTIILAATVIYELIGPLCTKMAIFKAKEACD